MIELYENIDNVIKILKDNNLVYNSYNFLVRIYMVPNNLNFGNIKSLEQLKNYAILEDNNREKKVIFKDNNELIGSISGLLSTKSLFERLKYKELMYINYSIYKYKFFKLIDVKDIGVFIEYNDYILDLLSKLKIKYTKLEDNIENLVLKTNNK